RRRGRPPRGPAPAHAQRRSPDGDRLGRDAPVVGDGLGRFAPHRLGEAGVQYDPWLAADQQVSFAGLLVASVLYSMPFAVVFSAVDRRLIEASWCLGISRLGTFFRVVVPLSWAGILTGIVLMSTGLRCLLTFAHTLGEFGVVLMVGGNIPGQTRTVSISI